MPIVDRCHVHITIEKWGIGNGSTVVMSGDEEQTVRLCQCTAVRHNTGNCHVQRHDCLIRREGMDIQIIADAFVILIGQVLGLFPILSVPACLKTLLRQTKLRMLFVLPCHLARSTRREMASQA